MLICHKRYRWRYKSALIAAPGIITLMVHTGIIGNVRLVVFVFILMHPYVWNFSIIHENIKTFT